MFVYGGYRSNRNSAGRANQPLSKRFPHLRVSTHVWRWAEESNPIPFLRTGFSRPVAGPTPLHYPPVNLQNNIRNFCGWAPPEISNGISAGLRPDSSTPSLRLSPTAGLRMGFLSLLSLVEHRDPALWYWLRGRYSKPQSRAYETDPSLIPRVICGIPPRTRT